VLLKSRSVLLSSLKAGTAGKFTGVSDHSSSFLNYLDKIGISLGDTIKIKHVEEFDKTYTLELKGKKSAVVSFKVANSLLVSEQ
jgi:DtxR family Mn-dependent transcriptional regulator